MEVDSNPVQNLTASCDTVLVSQLDDELLKTGGNSDLSHNSISSSTVSIYGSNSDLSRSVGSEATGNSNVDMAQIVDENDNIDPHVGGFTDRNTHRHWGESDHYTASVSTVRMDPSHSTNTSTPTMEETVDSHVDHGYSRVDFTKDPDLLSWYCLSTC